MRNKHENPLPPNFISFKDLKQLYENLIILGINRNIGASTITQDEWIEVFDNGSWLEGWSVSPRAYKLVQELIGPHYKALFRMHQINGVFDHLKDGNG